MNRGLGAKKKKRKSQDQLGLLFVEINFIFRELKRDKVASRDIISFAMKTAIHTAGKSFEYSPRLNDIFMHIADSIPVGEGGEGGKVNWKRRRFPRIRE